MSDERVRRAVAGDRAAFAAMVMGCHGRLFGIAMAFSRNEADSLDILQDALVDAWRALPTLVEVDRAEAWLARIVVNRARMFLRTRRRRPTADLDVHAATFDAEGHRNEDLRPWPVGADDLLHRRRMAERAAAIAEELPEIYREVWVLADVEQLSMAEVAEALGLTVPNVKTRLHRARLFLRDRLAE
jgi:RNA polymerase sigma-70 factor (ECF subfamily)